jgi:hypothetical protein
VASEPTVDNSQVEAVAKTASNNKEVMGMVASDLDRINQAVDDLEKRMRECERKNVDHDDRLQKRTF